MIYRNLFLLLLFAIVVSGCGNREDTPMNGAPAGTNVTRPSSVTEVIGIGRVEPPDDVVPLAAPVGGIVASVVRRDGDSVHAGDVLITLNDATEKLAVAQITQRIATQTTQVKLDEANVTETEARLANKRRYAATTAELEKTGSATRQNLDDAETEIRTLEATLSRYRAAVGVSKERLKELHAERISALHDQDLRTFRAPTDGVVLDMALQVGTSVTQYQTYAQFAPRGEHLVRCEVDELFADRVTVGQYVEIRLIGNQDVVAKGVISSVSPYLRKKSLFSEKSNDQEDRRVREAVIRVNTAATLLINAKVECFIKL
ncbi:MAG: efflux RND transporter periplasmic adaptor subunit [Ignavibacteria bacterium]|nr:efflux RND transporter periplasmic adaptor subunit [Ignavibacteria bacterium]